MMTQPTRQARQPVQQVHAPRVMVSVGGMNRDFAALFALLLSQRRRWRHVAACAAKLMRWVAAVMAVETGHHGKA